MSADSLPPHRPSPRRVRTLGAILRGERAVAAVETSDLAFGDALVVRTRNSTYVLSPSLDGRFHVIGGWFEREGRFGATVRISGCSWGGSAISTRILAAPGLFLEFANGVRTTRIQGVRLIPAVWSASRN